MLCCGVLGELGELSSDEQVSSESMSDVVESGEVFSSGIVAVVGCVRVNLGLLAVTDEDAPEDGEEELG